MTDTGAPDAWSRAVWEFRVVSLPRGTTREEARALLTSMAEREHWELDRLRVHPDGRRRIQLRRRIIRSRTVPPLPIVATGSAPA